MADKFKSLFTVPSKDLKSKIQMELWVNLPNENVLLTTESIEFSVTMPDYMFDAIKDSAPEYSTEDDTKKGSYPISRDIVGVYSSRYVSNRIFRKTFASNDINKIKLAFQQVTRDIVRNNTPQEIRGIKKIFIQNISSASHERNGVNGAYLGKAVASRFKYFICYELQTDQYSSLMKREMQTVYLTDTKYSTFGGGSNEKFIKSHSPDLPIFKRDGSSVLGDTSMYTIIDWTEEREAKCLELQNRLISLNQMVTDFINGFSENIDSIQIEHINQKMLQ